MEQISVARSARAEPRTGAFNALLLSLGLVAGLVSSLGSPLVPTIAAESGVSIPTAQWTLTGNLLVGAVATPILGGIASGHRLRITVCGVLAACLLGCLVSAVSPNFGVLLAGRLIQGGSLSLVPLAIAAARISLAPADFAKAAGVVSVSGLLGAGLGYPLSTAVAAHYGLVGAFLVGAVLCAVVLGLAVGFLPRRPHVDVVPMNWSSGFLLGAAVTSGLLAITWAAEGAPSGLTAPAALICPALGLAWVRSTLRSATPLVDLRLVASPVAVLGNGVALIAGVSGYVLFTVATQYVQGPAGADGLGRGVESAGWVILPFSITGFLASPAFVAMRRRMSDTAILVVACGFGLTSLVMLLPGSPGYPLVLVATGVGGFGVGLTFSIVPMLVTHGVPRNESAAALSFCQLIRTIGFSLGTTVSVALFALHTKSGELLPVYLGYQIAAATGAVLWLLLASWVLLTRRAREPSGPPRTGS